MEETKTYDVAILGSGPGGYVAAIRAGQLGLKTVVVEKDDLFGGTCLHVGCIPTKALLYTAELFDKLKEAREFGIVVDNPRLDWSALQNRKTRVVRRLATGISYLFKKNNVETLKGFGSLAGPGKLELRTATGISTVSARHIILATGSSPRSLPGLEIDGRAVLTNDEILSLPAQPRSLAVIGAGAVGVEFASIYASFGTEVTLIEILPRVLPLEDEEISDVLGRALRKRRIKVLTGTKLESVKPGETTVELGCTTSEGKTETVRVEKLLVAVGRKPRLEGIGLERVGVRTERGFVSVDGFMQTSVPGIYAVGDIVPSPQLAHVASAEGILAVEKIAGLPVRPLNYDHMPSATYCSPEVASVGLSEAEARKRGHEVKVGRFPFAASSKASILGEPEGMVKVVSEAKYDELLGVHIIGPHATDLIAEAVVALELEATAEALMRAVHPHPTLSESVMEAAHGAVGHPIHV
jgi:dihydrolipoamide dehydrogenase